MDNSRESEMKIWWEKIKEHPIYSKVAAQLMGWAIIGVIGLVFSAIYFQSILTLLVQKWVIQTWGFLVIAVILTIILVVAIMVFSRKANHNKTTNTASNKLIYFEPVRVVRQYTDDRQFLIKNNIARHIPDPPTFEYLGQLYTFDWGTSEGITPDDFNAQFSLDSALPSIMPYCQAFYEEKKREEPLWEKPYYWLLKEGEKDGPFCQRCYDVDKKLIRLQGGHNDSWGCLQCNKGYTGPNYKAPPPITRRTGGSSWMNGFR